MKLIVGLGNPGEKYAGTRHNIGFMTIEALAEKSSAGVWKLENKFFAEIIRTPTIIYAKPQTYMNDSGKSVSALCRFYKVKSDELYIIHDDLDIALGEFKIQHSRGPLVHYGVNSVEKELGTDQFWRVRIGVENREVRGNKGIPGEEYSLQNFTPAEKSLVDDVIVQVVERILVIR